VFLCANLFRKRKYYAVVLSEAKDLCTRWYKQSAWILRFAQDDKAC